MAVTHIHIALATKLDMRAVDTAEIPTQHGIVGDRYEGSRHRHVTIQSSEELALASEIYGSTINPGDTRRNITVDDAPLPTRPGDRITIGDVQFEVVRIAAPCTIMDHVIGVGAKTALRRKGGVVCRTLEGGNVTIGDAVELLPADVD
jgi:MOSC domain-containing protein YiiM